jgi:signal transduction histidine kinase
MRRWPALPIWFEGAAATLLALFVSTAVSVSVFQLEDRARAKQAALANMFERVADALSTIEKAPAALRPELLDALSRLSWHLTLDVTPLVAQGARDGAAEERLRELLASSSRGEVRIRPVLSGEAQKLADVVPRRSGLIPVGPVTMIISIDAGPIGWLNVRYFAPEPAPHYGPALISGLVAVVVMLLAIWWTRARFAKPLQALTAAATAFRRGEPVPEIPELGPPAVRAATRSFNAMSQRLTATLENQRSIMSAVAHDLRTPIAAMRLRTEFVGDAEERARLTQTLDEMQSMTEAVLSAARADRTGEAMRPVDLAALAESLVDDMKEMGGDVAFRGGGAVRCVCRTNEVRRALRNLIENALRYGARARVSVSCDRDSAFVAVEDDGPGIPADEVERVFEPFVRLEGSRSAHTGGYGLGLSIARWIARGHGGDVILRNRAGGGLNAILKLPLQG